MKAAIALIAFLLLQPTFAVAQEPAPHFGFDQLVGVVGGPDGLHPGGCAQPIRRMVESLQRYQELLKRDEAKDLAATGLRMRELMHALENDPVCYDKVAKIYVIGSAILTGDPARARAFAALVISSKLRIISYQTRQSLGGALADPSYSIRALYDCGTSVLWIDPVSTPLDLAADSNHVLDFMVRDKAGSIPPAQSLSSHPEALGQFLVKNSESPSPACLAQLRDKVPSNLAPADDARTESGVRPAS